MPKRFTSLLVLPALVAAASVAGAQPAKPAAAQPVARTGFIANMDAEFRKMDSNGDGAVVAKEVESFQRVQALAQARNNNRRTFAALDTDRNNQISPAEFSRLTANPPPTNPQVMLQRFDANRDGRIGMVEFRAGTVVNFDRMDTDKNGLLTAAEMKAGRLARKN